MKVLHLFFIPTWTFVLYILILAQMVELIVSYSHSEAAVCVQCQIKVGAIDAAALSPFVK